MCENLCVAKPICAAILFCPYSVLTVWVRNCQTFIDPHASKKYLYSGLDLLEAPGHT